ncbi:nitrate reductase molybdenum cofactor assembly chaperone [Mycolicibacterium novocastrense]|uniref:Nitrate reductase molybdenum cofactor assembly chaperone n=1 Tax=Mycolicibacterium novocastrense TaxID=59813 RepID=A0AAW5SF65_MYCNV|nr:nitrate reductase molybdenum cofactor assembly chaperone [Mycolicibacterium novocastrense]MCV7022474.1 nitrate reductase molybdenum cofactor assembly chaperone [Mycolicibacterium novocastrense]GAT08137.1 respiratory nitrate reductase delta subunit narJ [Mycolicibacterium novocastrense]
MKLLRSRRESTLEHRLVWQAAALLLTYPDDQHAERLATVEELLAHLYTAPADLLADTVAALRAKDPMQAQVDYVDTFDMRRRTTMYLTYWTAGDTRNRGNHMLAFTRTYREAGVNPPEREAPDYLPVVLEFAATVDPAAGRRLLVEHRAPIDLLCEALQQSASPYAPAVAAVCQTLPARTEQDIQRAQRLAAAGPPTESVGLQPFTLTVPPRRAQGV